MQNQLRQPLRKRFRICFSKFHCKTWKTHVLQAGAVVGGIAIDVYNEFFDVEKLTIKQIEKETEARKNQINTIQQNIEKIDQFATTTAKFADAAKAGNVDTVANYARNLPTRKRDWKT